MDNEELMGAFEQRTLKAECFPHREHVRVAWLLLQRHSLADAATRFSEGLRAIATAAGKAERYHETVTWAYLLIINDRIARQLPATESAIDGDSDGGWNAFATANADLLTNGRALLERWYHPETLDSPLARRTFVWPDRLPIAGQPPG